MGWKERHGKNGRETKGETQREAQTESCACDHTCAALPASLPSCVELVIDLFIYSFTSLALAELLSASLQLGLLESALRGASLVGG